MVLSFSAFLLPFTFSLSLSLGAADVGVCNLPLSDSDNFPLAPGQSANPWIPTSGFESWSFVRNLTKAHCRVNSVQPSFRLHFNRPPGGVDVHTQFFARAYQMLFFGLAYKISKFGTVMKPASGLLI